MGILQTLQNQYKNHPLVKKSNISPVKRALSLASTVGWPIELTGGTTVTENSSLNIAAVYTAVGGISQDIAVFGREIYKKTSEGRFIDQENDQSYLLKSRPSPLHTMYKWIQTMVSNYYIWGDSFARIYRDRRTGRPYRYEIRHPMMVLPFLVDNSDGTQTLSYYDVKSTEFVSYMDMIHFSDLSDNGIRGKSRIRLLRETLGEARAAESFGNLFYSNNAWLGGVLQKVKEIGNPTKNLTNDGLEAMRESFMEQYGAWENRGQVAALAEGWEFKPIHQSMPMADAEFLATRKFKRDEIFSIFHYPSHLGNNNDNANYSNVVAFNESYERFTLIPTLKMMEEEIDSKCFVPGSGNYYKFNISAKLRGNLKERFESYEKALQWGILNLDEVRDKEDLNPLPDGMGKLRLVPLNHIPIDKLDEYNWSKSNKQVSEKEKNT